MLISQPRKETLCSSGAGGQHVNKTETAVRAVHAPSGISVTASDQRGNVKITYIV